MQVLGFSAVEGLQATEFHIEMLKSTSQLLADLGEDCDVVLEFDDEEGDFSILFSGTYMSLNFTMNGIIVSEFDTETNSEIELARFNPGEHRNATLWLLTQVKSQNPSS